MNNPNEKYTELILQGLCKALDNITTFESDHVVHIECTKLRLDFVKNDLIPTMLCFTDTVSLETIKKSIEVLEKSKTIKKK